MTKREKRLLAYMGVLILMILFCIYRGTCLRTELDEYERLRQTINGQLFEAQQSLGIEMKKNLELNERLDQMSDDLNKANTTIADLKSAEYELVYLGDFKITHYCTELREHICGEGQGITASGTQVTAGRTVAVDHIESLTWIRMVARNVAARIRRRRGCQIILESSADIR